MLAVRNLVRTFGSAVAVDDVSFDVEPGSLVGFVGGNGAGKTTTMRMIMGVLEPTSGAILWNDAPATFADRRQFGYMPEERGLYLKQKVIDQLVYLAELHGIPRSEARKEAAALLDRFGLADRSRDRLEKLSLGNQQRVQIAAALLCRPKILVLDEPFSGLDPEAVDAMIEILQEHAARGVGVLFSSHQLELIERFVDGLVILSKGRVVAQGTKEQIRRGQPIRYKMICRGSTDWLHNVPGVTVVRSDDTSALFEVIDDSFAQATLKMGVELGEMREFYQSVPTIAELYREVTA